MSDPNNLEGPPPTAEERAAMARELDRVAPTPADKFRLMFGQRPTQRTDALISKWESLEEGRTHDFIENDLFDEMNQIERELAEAREQRDRLAEAARAVVDRWETPLWKDAAHTGEFIRALADALDALNVEMEARQ